MSSLFSVFTTSSTPANNTAQTSHSQASRSPPTPSQRTAEARAAFDASLASTGAAALDNELHSRAKNIHDNAAHLDEQDRRVQKETKTLHGEGDALEKALGKAERALGGESADGFEDEIRRIEAELDLLDDVLDEVEGKRVDTDAGELHEGGGKKADRSEDSKDGGKVVVT
ncbi:uncharacterized protein HMPREF1541_00080 [Cyphellophora europaea CBS 101466]|uniref:Biogenesis of lysosome-related organelles complex 1 subunit 1 n=1 Tax=Cyphellophora europaea (strain CBS 101466) TaxID=1220924 RepID=W2SDE1_CYPE1|nr:uncharacterized protein HMPREF1541_00080 [Cyphellophora europaea CBS 101466]ETN45899.1 hypothetical protein HMPREF1541_00080 [Cyphellophora europaea CBS 101466]